MPYFFAQCKKLTVKKDQVGFYFLIFTARFIQLLLEVKIAWGRPKLDSHWPRI